MGRFGKLWATLLAQHLVPRGTTLVVGSRSHFIPPPQSNAVHWEELLQSDTLFLCVAISALEEVLTKMAPHLSPSTVVIDTCSIKCYPEQLMRRLLPAEVEIVGMHPMFGPDSLQEGKFFPVAICPIRAAAATLRYWSTTLTAMGLHPLQMSSAEHDREVAYTQGFTHLIGRIAQQMDLKGSKMATLGYQKILALMQQTCNDSEELFIDLERFNPHTDQMLRSFRAAWKQIDKKIANAGGER